MVSPESAPQSRPVCYRTSRRVEFVDTDMAGIVHFSNFFRYMEAAEVEFLQSLGLSVALTWEGRKLGFPRVGASCDFTKPARFQDVLAIEVTLAKLGRSSVTYGFQFMLENEVVARGQVTCVCCSFDSGKPLASVEIPASIRAILLAAATPNAAG